MSEKYQVYLNISHRWRDCNLFAERERCEFFENRFVVSNQLIEGVIEYQSANGAEAIPQGEFVSFAVERTGVRIGSLNVVADGCFTLNLRAEYSFTWNDDPVTINYIKNGGIRADLCKSEGPLRKGCYQQ